MLVTIMGPLPDGLLHVHRTGCADLGRNHAYAGMETDWSLEACSVREIVEAIYADMLDEHPETGWTGYRRDVRVFSCAGELPEE